MNSAPSNPLRLKMILAASLGFLVSLISMYSWMMMKIPGRGEVGTAIEKVSQVKTRSPSSKDLVVQLESGHRFDYLDWYPKYDDVRAALRSGAIVEVFVREKPGEGNVKYQIWSLKVDGKTIVTFDEIRRKREANKRWALILGVVFFIFSAWMIQKLLAERKNMGKGLN